MPLAYPKVHAFTPIERGDSWISRFARFWQPKGWKRWGGVLLRRVDRTFARLIADLVWDTAGDFHDTATARVDGSLELLVRS
jgi:hypothetical protein